MDEGRNVERRNTAVRSKGRFGDYFWRDEQNVPPNQTCRKSDGLLFFRQTFSMTEDDGLMPFVTIACGNITPRLL